MTTPNQMIELGRRVAALTGRSLGEEELFALTGRAFAHRIDLNDDGQLRALLAGSPAGGIAAPPVSYSAPPPTWPGYQTPAHPHQHWAGWPSAPAAAPPVRMRHPAAFILAGVLIALAAPMVAVMTDIIAHRSSADISAQHRVFVLMCTIAWLVLTGAFALVSAGARPAGRALAVRATLAAGAAGLIALSSLFTLVGRGMPVVPLRVPQAVAVFAFTAGLIAFAVSCRPIFRLFGVITGVAAGILGMPLSITFLIGAITSHHPGGWLFHLPDVGWLAAGVFLLLFGIAVAVGRVPAEDPPTAP